MLPLSTVPLSLSIIIFPAVLALLNVLPPTHISYALTTGGYPIFDNYATCFIGWRGSQKGSYIAMGALTRTAILNIEILIENLNIAISHSTSSAIITHHKPHLRSEDFLPFPRIAGSLFSSTLHSIICYLFQQHARQSAPHRSHFSTMK